MTTGTEALVRPRVTLSGGCATELSIRSTFLGPFETPAGVAVSCRAGGTPREGVLKSWYERGPGLGPPRARRSHVAWAN